jgi:hypothetical protein
VRQGLLLATLVRGEPIHHGLFFVFQVLISFSMAVLGATALGFYGIALRIRATSALALFAVTYAYLSEILSMFDASSWIGTSSGILGLGTLFMFILTGVATAYSFVYKVRSATSTVQKRRVVEPLLGKTTLSRDDTEKLIKVLKEIETANTSIQAELSDIENETKGD